MNKLRIAIDGPSSSGKSTLARALAKELSLIYVDTGALYRTVGLYMCRHGIDPKDTDAVIAALPGVQVELAYENGVQTVLLCGENVGDSIRTPEMSM